MRFGQASMKGRQPIKIGQRRGYSANSLPRSTRMHDSIIPEHYSLDDLMPLDLSGFLDHSVLTDPNFLHEGDVQNSKESNSFKQAYPIFDDEAIWHDGALDAASRAQGVLKTGSSTVVSINREGSTTRSVLGFPIALYCLLKKKKKIYQCEIA